MGPVLPQIKEHPHDFQRGRSINRTLTSGSFNGRFPLMAWISIIDLTTFKED